MCLASSQRQGISAIRKDIFVKVIVVLFSARRKHWFRFFKKNQVGLRGRQEFTIGSHVAKRKCFGFQCLFAVVEKLKGCDSGCLASIVN